MAESGSWTPEDELWILKPLYPVALLKLFPSQSRLVSSVKSLFCCTVGPWEPSPLSSAHPDNETPSCGAEGAAVSFYLSCWITERVAWIQCVLIISFCRIHTAGRPISLATVWWCDADAGRRWVCSQAVQCVWEVLLEQLCEEHAGCSLCSHTSHVHVWDVGKTHLHPRSVELKVSGTQRRIS